MAFVRAASHDVFAMAIPTQPGQPPVPTGPGRMKLSWKSCPGASTDASWSPPRATRPGSRARISRIWSTWPRCRRRASTPSPSAAATSPSPTTGLCSATCARPGWNPRRGGGSRCTSPGTPCSRTSPRTPSLSSVSASCRTGWPSGPPSRSPPPTGASRCAGGRVAGPRNHRQGRARAHRRPARLGHPSLRNRVALDRRRAPLDIASVPAKPVGTHGCSPRHRPPRTILDDDRGARAQCALHAARGDVRRGTLYWISTRGTSTVTTDLPRWS
jgi:hypothetical protein